MNTYFNIEDHVMVTNPTSETFTWTVGGEREYSVEPGQVKRLHGSAAGLYVKKMTDLLIIQNNETPRLYDETLRKEMSEKLIVRVIHDDEDVDLVPTDLNKAAKENDIAPIKEAEFPGIKKAEPQKVELPKEDKVSKEDVGKTKSAPTAKAESK